MTTGVEYLCSALEVMVGMNLQRFDQGSFHVTAAAAGLAELRQRARRLGQAQCSSHNLQMNKGSGSFSFCTKTKKL